MKRFCGVLLLLVIVVFGAVLLVNVVAFITLLEVFLIATILLCILWWVNKLDNQIHLYRVQRMFRERSIRREFNEIPPRRRRSL
jgi:hypothetical protein